MTGHRKTWRVRDDQAGRTLAALVRDELALSWRRAKHHVHSGKVFVDGEQRTDVAFRPRPGQAIELRMNAPRQRAASPRVRIVHDDAHVVVIDKPAGVSSVPYEHRETGTAMDLLRDAWRRKHPGASRVPLHVVHRIDKATSGLLAFAKTKRAELGLAAQFRAHSIERIYLCVAHGHVPPGRIDTRLVRDRGDGLRGSTRFAHQGKRAVTRVEVIERLPAPGEQTAPAASLCRVTLDTGKTHQIRIHLAERGHPLVGEAVYIRDYLAAGNEPIQAPRLMLHAATLGFRHPITGERISCESPLPKNFTSVLRALGSRAPTLR